MDWLESKLWAFGLSFLASWFWYSRRQSDKREQVIRDRLLKLEEKATANNTAIEVMQANHVALKELLTTQFTDLRTEIKEVKGLIRAERRER